MLPEVLVVRASALTLRLLRWRSSRCGPVTVFAAALVASIWTLSSSAIMDAYLSATIAPFEERGLEVTDFGTAPFVILAFSLPGTADYWSETRHMVLQVGGYRDR